MVMFLSSSFLNLTVCTPDIAFTTVDLPCATCPIVPMLIVACLAIISGDKGVSTDISKFSGSGCSGSSGLVISASGSGWELFLSADLGLSRISSSSISSLSLSWPLVASNGGDPGSESSSEGISPLVAIVATVGRKCCACFRSLSSVSFSFGSVVDGRNVVKLPSRAKSPLLTKSPSGK